MNCPICKGIMIHLDKDKNLVVAAEDWKPETYICNDCEYINYF